MYSRSVYRPHLIQYPIAIDSVGLAERKKVYSIPGKATHRKQVFERLTFSRINHGHRKGVDGRAVLLGTHNRIA